ncbi:MAG: hydroxyacid dehydrogenase [Rhodospirillaceae bacterium]|jgi:D-3-phosphoglycerate dehydrogenase / 2-oxoglutarate reductase|nr:hydroxyacid dehydrogenase [Rhodospirillaceae bacterium]MBT6116420.1 hydroxyacid dehydrogenase [Rhodospirillaceae bacterium]
MVRILITHNNDLLENFYNHEAVDRMRELGEVRVNGTDEPLAGEALIEAAKDCEIIVSDRLAPGDPELFDRLPNLCAFLRCAVDIRNVDIAAASRNGVLVAPCSQGYDDAVAETALGLMLMLARRLAAGDRLYKAGEAHQPMVMTRQLAGASVGVIGYGAIGRRIGELALAFKMAVSAYDPYKRIVDGRVRQADLDTVLSEPDFVICAAYATPETERMMNRDAFAKMRSDAYFINISRGILVDEEALEEALTSGGIAGAGLDVGLGIDQQPSLALAKLPNVVAVPHVAGLTREASDHQAFETVDQVRDMLAGKLPRLAVNPGQASRLARLTNR